MEGIMGSFYKISEWIWRFIFINILWCLFLFPGLIIFGIFPSTVAMFTVIRKWVIGDVDIPVFKTFWNSYKKDFYKSNLLGIVITLIGYVLYVDYQFLHFNTNSLTQILNIVLFIVIIIYVLMLMYVFPIFVHYEIKIFEVLKNAFLIMIMYPFITIMMLAGSLLIYYVMTAFPGLIPIFGGSFLSFILMWCANFAFTKIHRIQELLTKHDEITDSALLKSMRFKLIFNLFILVILHLVFMVYNNTIEIHVVRNNMR